MNNIGVKQTAKAPIVLVSEGSGSSNAFITSVIVKSTGTGGAGRVHFKGISVFTEEVQKHIKETIVPIVDDIVDGLALERRCYDISIANLPTASASDGHIRIEGFSADLPVLTAMLSATLEMPLSSDILSTGHIASCCGEIISVKSLESKLQAAIKDDIIQKFIYPDHKCHNSFAEHHHIRHILADAVTSIKLLPVSSIYECLEQVFAPHHIVLSSLRKGYFESVQKNDSSGNYLSKAISYFTDNNPQRFWLEVQRLLMRRQNNMAKELFAEFCGYYIGRQKYPANAGRKLSTMISTIPGHLRRCDGFYPLCDVDLCVKMGQYAGRDDHYDFVSLLNSVTGVDKTNQPVPENPSPPVSVGFQNTAFDEVVNQLNQRSLAIKIDIPIDAARGSFVIEKPVVNSYEEFLEVMTAFIVHLRCHTDKTDLNSIDADMCKNDALELLDKAFRDQGGCQAAYVRASEGIDSGIRGVFNKMIDVYKFEQKAKYANRILKEAVDVMSWDERVDFMRSAIARIGNLLPQELRNQPPERFARDFEVITKAVIQSLDKMNNVFAGF